MKKRSLGVLLVLAVVLVLSFATVATASAVTLTSCTPSSFSNTTYGDQDVMINYVGDLNFGWNDPTITFYRGFYNEISANYQWLGYNTIYATINTYGESAGTYSCDVSWYPNLGGPAQTLTLGNAITVSGAPPITNTPVIESLSPKTKEAGSAGFQLNVYGYNFASGGVGMTSEILWNGAALATTVASGGSQLTALIPAQAVATAGTASVQVRNTIPGQSAALSNIVSFTITAVQPTLTAVNPTSGWAKFYQPYLLTLTGSNFQSGAQVLVNGSVHASTYVSSTQMTVQLTAADIANAGTLNLSVRNTAGQQPTNTVAFTLQADTLFPVTTITGNDDNWHKEPVVLNVSATEVQGPGVQNTYYGIGVPPAILLSGTTITVPAAPGGANDGPQIVQAYSTDKCGNVETPAKSVTVYICTVGPDTDVFAPSSVKKGKTCKIQYEADSITGSTSNILKIYKSNGSVAKSFNQGVQPANKQYTKSFTCNLAPGSYKVKLFATDAAGNAQSSQHSDSFQVTK